MKRGRPGRRAVCGEPFIVKDCALITLALGMRAQNLKEFRDAVSFVNVGSIYHHFWERLLRPQFDEPEYNNDFASWAFHSLHEKALAERLAIVDPTDHPDLESLRQEVVEVVEQRLDESEAVPWTRLDQQFHFSQSKTVIFDTGYRLEEPADLSRIVGRLSSGSVFYHFIDARRRTPDHTDDFTFWLAGCGEEFDPLRREVEAIDPYFSSLYRIRDMLTSICTRFFEVAED